MFCFLNNYISSIEFLILCLLLIIIRLLISQKLSNDIQFDVYQKFNKIYQIYTSRKGTIKNHTRRPPSICLFSSCKLFSINIHISVLFLLPTSSETLLLLFLSQFDLYVVFFMSIITYQL